MTERTNDYYNKYLPIVETYRETLEGWLPRTLEERTVALKRDPYFNTSRLSIETWDYQVGICEDKMRGNITVTNNYRFNELGNMLKEFDIFDSIANKVSLLKAAAYFQIKSQEKSS